MNAQSKQKEVKQKEPEQMKEKRSRGSVTRQALMRAAEKLIAREGLAGVSIRDIVTEAGQKNESALQYHFGNLKGLLAALHKMRDAEIQVIRSQMISEFEKADAKPSLRDICKLMVQPSFELASSKADFRRYVKAFGQEVTLTDEHPMVLMRRKGGETAYQVGNLLREAVSHLNESAFQRRLDGALRYISAAMYHEARRSNAFRGEEAQMFFSSLIDGLEGLLGAPESAETRALSKKLGNRSK